MGEITNGIVSAMQHTHNLFSFGAKRRTTPTDLDKLDQAKANFMEGLFELLRVQKIVNLIIKILNKWEK